MGWLFDSRCRYGYHGSLLLGSHLVTDAHGEGETTVTTRTRNTGLARLPYVVFISFVGLSAGGFLWAAEKPFTLPNKEMEYL